MITSGFKLDLGPLNGFLNEIGAYANALWHQLTAKPEMMSNIGWAN